MLSKALRYWQNTHTFFSSSLWQEAATQGSQLKRKLMHLLRIAYVMGNELRSGYLSLHAMSLVFTTLLSLVPLIAVAFSVLKAFGVHNQIEPFLLNLLDPLGPKGQEVSQSIIGFVENIKVGVLGSLGLAMLFYTIIALIQKVENAFNYVWRVERPRTLARRFTDYLSVVMIGPVLVFSALGVTGAVLDNDFVAKLESIEPFGTLLLIISKLLPYFMIILAFTFLYTFIPNTKVKFSAAFSGATVAGVLWVTLGTLFAGFVASSSNYTAIYSGFAILFFFMIWVYLAWFILLTGSQVAFFLQHPKLVQLGGKPQRLSPRLRDKEGLWLMIEIARRFCQDRSPLTMQELEQQTTLSAGSLQEIINMLENDGLLIEVDGPDSQFVPGRDLSVITVQQILDCLRSAEERDLIPMRYRAAPAVEHLLSKLRTAEQQQLADITLRDLAMDNLRD
ncbi:MAG: YhjD/YihY/BrkB family envelope integrity protein [Methylophaga sp.]|nr:YhjD/YihY/BrkB family envelope integrity protein [Methylophaga sp.]